MPEARLALPELDELEALIELGGGAMEVRRVCETKVGTLRFPVHAIALGNPEPSAPAVGFYGGVHGLERIGAAVVLSYLRSVVTRLAWDDSLCRLLESTRLVFMPIVNPGGMWLETRANPNGVDLMRNAPVESRERVPFMIGGQRLTRALPWYRGAAGNAMELESQALCRVAGEELIARPFSIAIDCHSGFGISDRIWFPFAHSSRPIPHLAEVQALAQIFDRSYRHHAYVIEPQSRQYLAHGDLWDYLYLRSAAQGERIFLPLTLEMGSWLWVKKNPRQIFSRDGFFNPIAHHRLQRVLRRHIAFLDFLTRSAASHRRWMPAAAHRAELHARAMSRWYPESAR